MRRALVLVAACGSTATTPHAPSDDDVAGRAAHYVDAFTNCCASLTGDGRVVFISNRSGLPQLYVGDVDHPDRPPRRIATPERVAGPVLAPGGAVVFASDVGSDQKFHLFRTDLDGKHVVDVTPTGDLHRDRPRVARETGTLVYDAHAMTDPSTLVFVQTGTSPPREVHRDPLVGGITDVTADGSRALLVKAVSETELIADVVDLATGTATRVYPPAGDKIAISSAGFAADGKSIFVASEASGRPARVLRIDASNGSEQASYNEATIPTASIGDIRVSPRGDRVVVDLDAGDHSELRILDANDLHLVATPKLPLGALGLGDFAPDGLRLALTITGATGPSDLALLDLATGAIRELRSEPRPGLGAPPRASIEKLPAFDGLAIPINLYLPADTSTRRPTLVLVHGGPSGSAKLAWSPTIGFWTGMGFAVIAPNIRGSTGFGLAYEQADDRDKRGDAVKDIETINQWARAQPWCDGDRIIIGGISYGGYMTLLALTRQPALWRAGIDGSGMSNLVTMEQLEDQSIRALDDTEFGVLGKDDELLKEWSPITAVDKIIAPVFVYQGVRDPVTPQKEADQIVEALRKRHIPVEYMLVANEGHGVTRRENNIDYLSRSYRFVMAHMK